MRVVRHHSDTPPEARGAVVALGNFDGVHRGHQALIGAARERAGAENAPLGVLVFEPHPQEFFKPDAPRFRLTPFRPKATLLAALGVDVLYALPFGKKLASMTAEQFVTEVLVAGLGVRHVLVGADFLFGKGRSGDVALLERLGRDNRYGLTIFAPIAAPGGGKISSTAIREALRAGDPMAAARALGHWWTVEGHVQPGDRRGRTIGFPTANLSLKGYLEPALGVYAVRVRVGERSVDGVANFGRRPTFNKKDTLLEVHLFDFAGDLYGRSIDVAFVDFLRPERKFDGLESLKAQIARDSEEARRRLKAAGPKPPLL